MRLRFPFLSYDNRSWTSQVIPGAYITFNILQKIQGQMDRPTNASPDTPAKGPVKVPAKLPVKMPVPGIVAANASRLAMPAENVRRQKMDQSPNLLSQKRKSRASSSRSSSESSDSSRSYSSTSESYDSEPPLVEMFKDVTLGNEPLLTEDLDDPAPVVPPRPPFLRSFPTDVPKALETYRNRLNREEKTIETKEDTKAVSLSTSKVNYIDPRIVVSWAAEVGVPINKLFSQALVNKFSWAMDARNYEF